MTEVLSKAVPIDECEALVTGIHDTLRGMAKDYKMKCSEGGRPIPTVYDDGSRAFTFPCADLWTCIRQFWKKGGCFSERTTVLRRKSCVWHMNCVGKINPVNFAGENDLVWLLMDVFCESMIVGKIWQRGPRDLVLQDGKTYTCHHDERKASLVSFSGEERVYAVPNDLILFGKFTGVVLSELDV